MHSFDALFSAVGVATVIAERILGELNVSMRSLALWVSRPLKYFMASDLRQYPSSPHHYFWPSFGYPFLVVFWCLCRSGPPTPVA